MTDAIPDSPKDSIKDSMSDGRKNDAAFATAGSGDSERTDPESGATTAVEAVVFDMDGTLVDSMSVVPRAYAECISAVGGPRLTDEDVLGAFHVGPPAALLGHFLQRPATAADLEQFQQTFEALGDHVVAFPGVAKLLDALAAYGLPLAVFTGAGRRSAAFLLSRAALDRGLTTVVGGDEVSRAKPAPDGLLLACRRLGVSAKRTAYVGDSEVDIGCARRAGAWAIHAGWGATRPLGVEPDVRVTGPERLRALLVNGQSAET